jgi:hypothetical protein
MKVKVLLPDEVFLGLAVGSAVLLRFFKRGNESAGNATQRHRPSRGTLADFASVYDRAAPARFR